MVFCKSLRWVAQASQDAMCFLSSRCSASGIEVSMPAANSGNSSLISWQFILFPLLPRNKLFQLLAQGFVGAEQQRLGGGLAQFQHARNLAIIHLLILVHNDRDALALGQRI